jgi:vacuolar-type H+-ATPase subunit H
MPLDPRDCREHAKRCIELAAETTDPKAQEILTNTAQNWERLASKLADAQEELLAQCLR